MRLVANGASAPIDKEIYPLVASVAEALAHYIDTVRPPTTSQQVFMTVQAPLRPIASSAIYHVVHRRFAALGIQTPHQGPPRCDTPALRAWSPMA